MHGFSGLFTTGRERDFKNSHCQATLELEAQRVILAEEGCDEIQGYLCARPMSAEELEKHYLKS